MNRTQSVTVVALASLFLAACSKDDAARPASQVAAKVNKEEITVHQVNSVLTGVRARDEAQMKQIGRQVLERLIDQELLVQRAIEAKLDRDPKIMAALDGARRQVLAQAYMDTVLARSAKPSPEEVKAFYDQRPELFAARRVYRLQELAIAPTAEQRPQVEAEIAKGRSLEDLARWMRDKSVPFNANASAKPAEQLPLELLPKIAQLREGQSITVPVPSGLNLVRVAASQPAPLDLDRARPFIEQYLVNQQRVRLGQDETKQLRASAKIDYIGEYGAAPAGKSMEPGAGSAAQEAADAAGVVPAAVVERGISGLK